MISSTISLRLRHIALTTALAAALAACGNSDKSAEQPAATTEATTETTPAVGTETTAPTAPEAGAETPAATTETASTGPSLPTECEAYVTAVEQCVSKLGADNAGAKAFKDSMETARSAWAQVADQKMLAGQCKQMSDQFATSAKAMGC